MELVLSIAFGVWYVITGIVYWCLTRPGKDGDRK